ncbi:hypothetical protein [Rhizobium sp. Root1220]|uniref:hypothetical protein n=1 Tax=Rhizobium sp. Root1220 TaxID=1736432 RepID=UPI0006F3E85A|nr:hypothetical protein [Rhizobium sp. Root1220]KQV73026.1 hypothetical protein ASC90_06325 [Rhizobium sp. Root1220]
MALSAEKRKLAELLALVRPRQSMAARMAALSLADRLAFERWATARKEWHSKFDAPGDAYTALLDGNEGPALNWRISQKVFAPAPEMPITESIESIRQKYAEYAETKT